MDDRSFTDFMGPLPPDVDALFRCTLTRSSGEPEQLAAGYGVGYFHLVWNRGEGLSANLVGGSATLTEALAAALGERARTGTRGRARDTDRRRRRRRAPMTRRDCSRARGDRRDARVRHARDRRRAARGDGERARAIPYGPYVVGAFLTAETGPAPWDDLYALATPKRSFGMLFNTANVLRVDGRRDPGGSLMVYAAADLARSLDGLSDDEIAARFRADLSSSSPRSTARSRRRRSSAGSAASPTRRSAARSSSRRSRATSRRSSSRATTSARGTRRRRRRPAELAAAGARALLWRALAEARA